MILSWSELTISQFKFNGTKYRSVKLRNFSFTNIIIIEYEEMVTWVPMDTVPVDESLLDFH